ncbi:hypothetical protein Patl1_14173 [Pistacia atlantica]|uniref:Uncharacterized protein n=1 Tax=Pistacia atlantica TaxID=434234 RepID=A0ACC1AS50_9ROSI|nr:hypothetical protein Patl1_14173 [Pistacia atlantica]
MEEPTFFNRMITHLRTTCKYYTGYPKDLGPSRVTHFTSEREFVQLLHQGYPVVVAFTIRGNYTKHLDRVLEEAASEYYPHVKFMRVECPKYPGFCLTRQRKEYPFVEIFHSPEQVFNLMLIGIMEGFGDYTSSVSIDARKLLSIMYMRLQASNQGKGADPNVTKYSVKVLPFNYDLSCYGFREFFKRHGIRSTDPQ